MREAMLKEKQAQVDEAVRLRTEAEALYKQAQQELRQERDRIQQLEVGAAPESVTHLRGRGLWV